MTHSGLMHVCNDFTLDVVETRNKHERKERQLLLFSVTSNRIYG